MVGAIFLEDLFVRQSIYAGHSKRKWNVHLHNRLITLDTYSIFLLANFDVGLLRLEACDFHSGILYKGKDGGFRKKTILLDTFFWSFCKTDHCCYFSISLYQLLRKSSLRLLLTCWQRLFTQYEADCYPNTIKTTLNYNRFWSGQPRRQNDMLTLT